MQSFWFPSPCGVMDFEPVSFCTLFWCISEFPSPCGVMDFERSYIEVEHEAGFNGFRPLAG